MEMTRRGWLKAAGALGMAGMARAGAAGQYAETTNGPTADQQRRMAWWHAAKFGMFIHWGLYSTQARHEWAMEEEAIPVLEYERLAAAFQPVPGAAKGWARLARQAGMKYMVMTTKHHEGFCNWDSRLTNYNSMKQGPKRDLVREFVEAARGEGMRVGFYYSLMDWHHPDGARCATDDAARRRFVAYTHGLIRELMTNYGKVDVLWYDVDWPLTAEGWDSERMNKMVFELQPEIVVNNRNGLPGDFSTPEQTIEAAKGGRAWESCMTMNDSWGFQRADDAWKSPKTIVRNVIQCARDGGNYLLNIGPHGDGTIPKESVEILQEVGQWMAANGETVYASDVCQVQHSQYATFSRKGNTLYMHVYFWPGPSPVTSAAAEDVAAGKADAVVAGEMAKTDLASEMAKTDLAISGLRVKVLSARLLRSGVPVTVRQDELRTHLLGLPADAPDSPVTTIALECEGEPRQDTDYVRVRRERVRVGV